MKPLIVAATRFEIQQCIPFLEKKQIPYLITGVGMTATAYALGRELALNPSINSVINVGIAGSFNKKITLGNLVSISSDTFYELGAEDGDQFISIEDLGFGKGTYFANDESLHITLPKMQAITVNRVHGDEKTIQKVLGRYPNCQIESMEGAAVFYACAAANLHCAQVRALSNYVERRDKSLWKIDLALKNLNDWLQNFILENY